MKRYGRRLLALLLALTLGMNMVITAWAAETEGEATNHDNVELSGSLGGMLAAELENGTETAARGSRNGVMNLTVDGSAATVTYQTDVSANVAVALYDETTGRMLQTAMAEADSEANAVTVQFAGGGGYRSTLLRRLSCWTGKPVRRWAGPIKRSATPVRKSTMRTILR